MTIFKTVKEESEEFSLTYAIIQKKDVIEEKSVLVYGIEVTLHSVIGKDAYSKVEGITSNREFVITLMEKIADGLVTPISLLDVVEDLIA